MSITIKEIAKLAGVSLGTASNALSGVGTKRVSEETRAKVLAVAKAHHYRMNPFGRALREGRSRLAGVIFPNLLHESLPVVLQGIEDELTKNGYGMLFHTYSSREELKRKCEALLDRQVDGVVMSPEFAMPQSFYDLYKNLEKTVPVVATSGIWQEQLPRVLVDGYEIGVLGTRHLLDYGHTRIALVNELTDWRTDGYRDTLEKAGIAFRADYVFHDFSNGYNGARIFDWVMTFPPELRPTAVFCLSDATAAELQNAAHETGLVLPRDLSVVGTDGLRTGTLAYPQLTSIGQPHYEQGAAAVRMLLKKLAGQEAENVLLHPFLVERASVWTFPGAKPKGKSQRSRL